MQSEVCERFLQAATFVLKLVNEAVGVGSGGKVHHALPASDQSR